jgi:hypothetical protein
MFEDVILDSNCLHPFNHWKISVIHFSPIFNNTPLKFTIPLVCVVFVKTWKKSLQMLGHLSVFRPVLTFLREKVKVWVKGFLSGSFYTSHTF